MAYKLHLTFSWLILSLVRCILFPGLVNEKGSKFNAFYARYNEFVMATNIYTNSWRRNDNSFFFREIVSSYRSWHASDRPSTRIYHNHHRLIFSYCIAIISTAFGIHCFRCIATFWCYSLAVRIISLHLMLLLLLILLLLLSPFIQFCS